MNLLDQVPAIVIFLIQILTFVGKKMKKHRKMRESVTKRHGDAVYVDDYLRSEDEYLR